MRTTGFEGFGVLAFGFEVEIILGVWKTVRWRVWSVSFLGLQRLFVGFGWVQGFQACRLGCRASEFWGWGLSVFFFLSQGFRALHSRV